MGVQVGVDPVIYYKKPSGPEYNVIKKRAAENWGEIDLGELAEIVGNGHHAMLPGHLIGGTKSENCVALQVFALDFDGGVTYKEIKKRCDEWDLRISFAYETLSSSEELQKFRVVFAHESLITDSYIFKIVLLMLQKIFPECDKMCKNPDRLFLGGKQLLYVDNDARIALVQLLPPFYKALDSNENYMRNLRNFCRKNNILIQNDGAVMGKPEYFPEVVKNDGKPGSPIIHIIGNTENPSFFIVESKAGDLHQGITIEGDKSNHINTTKYFNGIGKKDLRNIDGDSACFLLNDFLNGIILNHDQRFAICTNLLAINGGLKLYRQTLEKYYDADTVRKWDGSYRYMKNYKPMSCSGEFCPYCQNKQCVDCGTIVRTIEKERKVKIAKREYVTLDEAFDMLDWNLRDAIHANGRGIHLIKGQTAIGKTEIYSELIADDKDHQFIVALPTNILKYEVKERLRYKGIFEKDIYVTPSVRDDHSLIEGHIKEEYLRKKNKGLHREGKKILRDYLKELENEDTKPYATIREVEELLELPDEAREARIILTTHARLLHMPAELLQDRICIVDEDILQLQLLNNTHSLSMDAVENLKKAGLPGYSSLAAEIIGAPDGTYTRSLGDASCAQLTEEQIHENQLEGDESDDVNDLPRMRAFVKIKLEDTGERNIRYFCPEKLPDIKVIIMSATLNEKIYSAYFKDRKIITHPVQTAKYQGRVIQYTYHSLGRRDLEAKGDAVFDLAKELLGEAEPVIITFQKFEKKAGAGRHRIHFGNAAGIDRFKGKNIAVIGTPYRVEFCYKLAACYLGADVNKKEDLYPRMRYITHDGNEFLMMTYADGLLREVQLYGIQSELEQCVGRARLLRNECTVYVFSCFPCEQAEIRSGNYLEVGDEQTMA